MIALALQELPPSTLFVAKKCDLAGTFVQKISLPSAPIAGPLVGFHPSCLLLGAKMVADVDSVHPPSAKPFHFTSAAFPPN